MCISVISAVFMMVDISLMFVGFPARTLSLTLMKSVVESDCEKLREALYHTGHQHKSSAK